MPVLHRNVMAGIDPDHRERIRAKAREIIEEEMTPRDLRRAQQLTQQRPTEPESSQLSDSVPAAPDRSDR